LGNRRKYTGGGYRWPEGGGGRERTLELYSLGTTWGKEKGPWAGTYNGAMRKKGVSLWKTPASFLSLKLVKEEGGRG